jgi:inhibitor of KinA sporulation pathway (predicted exonuclease)
MSGINANDIPYKFICVLDFEATCEQNGNNQNFKPRNEIIEFPSVLLKWDLEKKIYEKVSEIQMFCKPLYNIELTDFCKTLTGITQEQVNSGIDFTEALDLHHKWLMDNTGMYEDPANSVVITTMGFWDLCTMLPAECRRWSVLPSPIYRQVINVKTAFETVYNEKKQGMDQMLKTCGIKLEGRHHSGIDDSRNIAKLVQHFTNRGFVWSPRKLTRMTVKDYEIRKNSKGAIIDRDIVKKRLVETADKKKVDN